MSSANMETRNHAEGHGTLYQELCNCNDTTLPNNWAGVTTQYNSINWLTQKTLKKQLQLIFKIHYCSYCSINAHANISALLLLCCLAMWWGAGSVRIYTAPVQLLNILFYKNKRMLSETVKHIQYNNNSFKLLISNKKTNPSFWTSWHFNISLFWFRFKC